MSNGRAHLYQNKGDLTTGDIGAHLFRLTLPMTWGLLAIISVQLVDTYFIAQLGDRELAGVSFTFPVTIVISHFLFGLTIALSSVLARLIGEKKIDDVRRVTQHGFILGLLSAAGIAGLVYIYLDPLFRLIGADDHTLPVIRDFMPLWLLSAVIMAIPVNANSAMRAGGDTMTASMVMLTIAGVNLILNPILIFGWFGLPAFGVTGSALATLLAHLVAAVLAAWIVLFKKDLVAVDGLHLDKLADSARRLVVIAIPAGITNIITPASSAVIVAILSTYGPEAVAAYGIASRVEAFAMLAVIALALGMAPVIGQNWGAQNYARVQETLQRSFRFNYIWSLGVAAVLALAAYPIAHGFSAHPEIGDIAAQFFLIVPVSYALGNLVFGWSSAFNAMGYPARSLIMIVSKAAVTITGAMVGGYLGGTTGIFVAISLANIVTGAVSHAIGSRLSRA